MTTEWLKSNETVEITVRLGFQDGSSFSMLTYAGPVKLTPSEVEKLEQPIATAIGKILIVASEEAKK